MDRHNVALSREIVGGAFANHANKPDLFHNKVAFGGKKTARRKTKRTKKNKRRTRRYKLK